MSIHTDEFEPARRIVTAAAASPNEEAIERALRPKGLAEYTPAAFRHLGVAPTLGHLSLGGDLFEG